MFLARSATNLLKVWKKSNNRKPLLIRGARQVGKTRLIEEFSKKEFKNSITLNFEEDPALKEIFERDLNIPRIINLIEVKFRKKINPADTLLFFDEIQACPNAVTALRYFYEKAKPYFVIAAGSLLEFVMKDISFPVGRVESFFLYPFSFKEFLTATGREILASKIPRFNSTADLPEALDPVLLGEFNRALDEYLLIGGMPEAVETFVTTQSLFEVFKVQKLLLGAFIDDSRKYASGEKQLENISAILQRIPKFIGNEITYATLGDGDSYHRTKRSLELLNLAMVITTVHSASPFPKPLSATFSEKHFKCLFLDVGLVSRILGIEAVSSSKRIPDRSIAGLLYEQFVGQELLAREHDLGLQERKLFCWIRPERTAKAEVDYLVSIKGETIPLEVKSGAFGKFRSLTVLLKEYPKVPYALVLSPENQVQKSDRIIKLPIFTNLHL